MADEINLEDFIKKEYGEMGDSIEHLKNELVKIRAGKASPTMVNELKVDYYGSPTPLNQVSNVTTSDARTIMIQPWEKAMLAPIEKAIFEANLGITPQNNGEMVIINVPPLTEERRVMLVKQVKKEGEDAKVSIRSARHKAMEAVKKEINEGYPEDAGKRDMEAIEDKTKQYIAKVDAVVENKEKDIMTV